MKNRRLIIWSTVAVLLYASVLRADVTGYTATRTDNSVVYFTNFNTGEQTPLGPSGISHIMALELSPVNGFLFATVESNPSGLWKIDKATGVGTPITGSAWPSYVHSLAFDSTGQLYGIARTTDELFRIDTETGERHLVGSTFPYTSINSFAISASGEAIGWDSGADWLFKIDLNDGSTTSIGSLPGDFDSFDYDPNGLLYGWRYDDLYSIDTNSLSTTFLLNFPVGGYGFAMPSDLLVPEPNILVSDPNGAETLFSGDTYSINWSSIGAIGDVLIGYSANNGGNWSDVDTVSNSGSYDWLVPAINSAQCLVRISNANDPNINDVSNDVFTIKTSDTMRMVPGEYLTIQEAINDSNDGDTVLVSQGRYYENIDFRGKAITVTSTNPNEPNCVDNTIIDADGDGIVVSFHLGEDANSIISGFTITGGYAQYGGAIVCWEYCSPTIVECNIGGNSATEDGGGIYCAENANPNVVRCNLGSNSAITGGGMYCISSSPTLTSCTFTGNLASSEGGGMYCYDASPILNGCTFTGNLASHYGGGMYCYNNSYPVLSDCSFTGNSAYKSGGGMYCDGGSRPMLTGCTLSGNLAVGTYPDGYGGGMFCAGSSPVIGNCVLISNYAEEDGGGIYSVDNSTPVIENSIICNSPSGTGIYAMYSDPIIQYNNVYGNVDGDYGGWAWPGEGDISVDPCFVDSGDWVDVNDPNIAVEPNDPNAMWLDGDYHLKSEAGRWNPNTQAWVTDAVTSPCIDVGDPCSDWTAELWPHGGRINMGAYGGTAEASMSLSTVGNIADLNLDGSVDYLDLGLIGDGWLIEEVLLSEDMDRNGIVNCRDYAIFALNWLWQE